MIEGIVQWLWTGGIGGQLMMGLIGWAVFNGACQWICDHWNPTDAELVREYERRNAEAEVIEEAERITRG